VRAVSQSIDEEDASLLSGEPVVFVEEPVVGRQARYTDGSREKLSSVVASVKADPDFPGALVIETESGEVYTGPYNPQYDTEAAVFLDPSGELREVRTDVEPETMVLPGGIVRDYNWGAALLPFIWGPAHGVWGGLLGLIPFAAPIVFGVFLARGNLWAWTSGRYADYDDLCRSQGKWVVAGVIWTVIGIAAIIYTRPLGWTPPPLY
jgi:hypothetical protein